MTVTIFFRNPVRILGVRVRVRAGTVRVRGVVRVRVKVRDNRVVLVLRVSVIVGDSVSVRVRASGC
jgi:hypothetical protein